MSEALLKLRVTPRGSKNEITAWRGDMLCVKITAPPVEGAANAALIKFIARSLGVRKSQVRLVSGEKSRDKALGITGITQSDLRAKLP